MGNGAVGVGGEIAGGAESAAPALGRDLALLPDGTMADTAVHHSASPSSERVIGARAATDASSYLSMIARDGFSSRGDYADGLDGLVEDLVAEMRDHDGRQLTNVDRQIYVVRHGHGGGRHGNGMVTAW